MKDISDVQDDILASTSCITVPGRKISKREGYVQGCGTYLQDDIIYSSLFGKVEKINKLLKVHPPRSRYLGNVGDVVVGRVVHVSQKRWYVDIHGHQHAVLNLASIQIPGIQRRKLENDEFNIRKFFVENDILVAEVQTVHSDGSVSLQTRNSDYGKILNGCLVEVSPQNVKRSKSHLLTIFGIRVILGLNGYIWLGSVLNANVSVNSHFQTIIRLRNIIILLDDLGMAISEESIVNSYEHTIDFEAKALSTTQKDSTTLIHRIRSIL